MSGARGRVPALVALAAAAAAALLAGCGSGGGAASQTSSSSTTGGSASGGQGTVKVLYAGSLTNMMEHDLGPAFEQASGDGYQGFAAGSTQLASEIKGKVRVGDVFISASPDADTAAGGHVRWYATFARAPVVIGYNPKSRFASDFRDKPWYKVIEEPGIRVGRTDPKLDPKGQKTVAAIDQAASKLHRPDLKQALRKFDVYPEETLVGRLQSGQLDAGFFYSNEAREQQIPTVSIEPADQRAAYTVTVLRGAPDEAAGEAFVRYLLGRKGTATLRAHGLTVIAPPQLSGDSSAIPPGLGRILHAGK